MLDPCRDKEVAGTELARSRQGADKKCQADKDRQRRSGYLLPVQQALRMRCGAEHRRPNHGVCAPACFCVLVGLAPHTWLFVPVANLVPGYGAKQRHGIPLRTSLSHFASAVKKKYCPKTQPGWNGQEGKGEKWR